MPAEALIASIEAYLRAQPGGPIEIQPSLIDQLLRARATLVFDALARGDRDTAREHAFHAADLAVAQVSLAQHFPEIFLDDETSVVVTSRSPAARPTAGRYLDALEWSLWRDREHVDALVDVPTELVPEPDAVTLLLVRAMAALCAPSPLEQLLAQSRRAAGHHLMPRFVMVQAIRGQDELGLELGFIQAIEAHQRVAHADPVLGRCALGAAALAALARRMGLACPAHPLAPVL